MSTSTALIPSGISGRDSRSCRAGCEAATCTSLKAIPGTGKTTFCLQFLLEGLRRGERCLLISLAESPEEIAVIAAAHGWSIDGLEVAI